MVGTIGVAVRDPHLKGGRQLALSFVGASTLAGMVPFAAVVAVGASVPMGGALDRAMAVSAGLAAVLAAARVGGVGPRPLCLARQVPEGRFSWPRRWAAGGAWGAEIGLGVVTFVPTWLFWGSLAAVGAAADWRLALVCGALYGATRGSQPLLAAALGESRWNPIADQLERLLPFLTCIAAGALLAVAISSIV